MNVITWQPPLRKINLDCFKVKSKSIFVNPFFSLEEINEIILIDFEISKNYEHRLFKISKTYYHRQLLATKYSPHSFYKNRN